MGRSFGDATIAANVGSRGMRPSRNLMPLTLASDPVDDQQVYTASWFLSYPGNSGGPLYVQLDGYYYPAGFI